MSDAGDGETSPSPAPMVEGSATHAFRLMSLLHAVGASSSGRPLGADRPPTDPSDPCAEFVTALLRVRPGRPLGGRPNLSYVGGELRPGSTPAAPLHAWWDGHVARGLTLSRWVSEGELAGIAAHCLHDLRSEPACEPAPPTRSDARDVSRPPAPRDPKITVALEQRSPILRGRVEGLHQKLSAAKRAYWVVTVVGDDGAERDFAVLYLNVARALEDLLGRRVAYTARAPSMPGLLHVIGWARPEAEDDKERRTRARSALRVGRW